jgi:hypothetical protein
MMSSGEVAAEDLHASRALARESVEEYRPGTTTGQSLRASNREKFFATGGA